MRQSSALGCFFVFKPNRGGGGGVRSKCRFAAKKVGNMAQNSIVYNFITSYCVSLILFSGIMALKNDTRLCTQKAAGRIDVGIYSTKPPPTKGDNNEETCKNFGYMPLLNRVCNNRGMPHRLRKRRPNGNRFRFVLGHPDNGKTCRRVRKNSQRAYRNQHVLLRRWHQRHAKRT